MRVKHLLVNGLVLESLESGHLDVLHEAVHLLLGLFVVVALPRDPDADPLGDVAHTLGPHELVKLGVNPHVLGAHLLLSKLPDLADRTAGLLLEGTAE